MKCGPENRAAVNIEIARLDATVAVGFSGSVHRAGSASPTVNGWEARSVWGTWSRGGATGCTGWLIVNSDISQQNGQRTCR